MTHNENDLFLVDGSGYIFRAYYAVPQNLTNPEGVPVGAVLGFTNMMIKLLTDLKAKHIAVIYDAARVNFRNEIYSDYKANRSDPPEDLVPQFGLIREATQAFGLPALELEGYEADDLIAAYAKAANDKGQGVTIVGTDKDLMQLVSPSVRLYDPIKQIYIGPDEVTEKFGVPPEKVIDVQALSGDSIDNVPGVPGIGPKTAAQLITEYGDLETLLDRASEIKQNKRRENLINHANEARISKKLVTLDVNAPLPVPLDALTVHDPNTPDLAAFLKKQGFNSVLARLGQTVDAVDAPDDTPKTSDDAPLIDLPPISDNQYTLITDLQILKNWLETAKESGILAFDTETTDLTPARAKLVGISIAIEPGKAAYIPVGHTQSADLLETPDNSYEQLAIDDVMAAFKPVMEDKAILKIAHNAKYDLQLFYHHGVRPQGVDDTMLLSYVLDGTQHSHGMDNLSAQYFGHQPISYDSITGTGKKRITFDQVPIDAALDYAAEDADITLRLHHVLKPRLVAEKMVTVYEDIERPLIHVIADMEYKGIIVDPLVLSKLSQRFGESLAMLESQIHDRAGHPFNLASPKQLGQVLFDEMGLPGGKKTKTGDWSTNAATLEKLAAEGHDFVEQILDWRQLSKLKSTYTDSLPKDIIERTKRAHTSYSMAGTTTGRLASSEPNLQNIPIRTEDGRSIRTAFVAPDGYQILSADYSQIELRLAAEMAGIKALQQAFRDKVDIHTLTAAQVFGLNESDVTPEKRRQAKAVNFGIIYGISGWGLAKQLGTDAGTANEFIRAYLSRFPELQDYMDARKEEAKRHGYVQTLLGRKCTIDGIRDKNGARRAFAERQAINAPLQGTAADIIKLAMHDVATLLRTGEYKTKMLLQVHDELVFEVPETELEIIRPMIKDTMEKAYALSVPLEVETGIGDSWAAAH